MPSWLVVFELGALDLPFDNYLISLSLLSLRFGIVSQSHVVYKVDFVVRWWNIKKKKKDIFHLWYYLYNKVEWLFRKKKITETIVWFFVIMFPHNLKLNKQGSWCQKKKNKMQNNFRVLVICGKFFKWTCIHSEKMILFPLLYWLSSFQIYLKID